MSNTNPSTTSLVRAQPNVRIVLPGETVRTQVWFGDEQRRLPTHLVAGSGSGKSLFTGRTVGLFDLLRRRGQVILDPAGGLVNALLHEIMWLPADIQRALWPRIHYTDLGSTDYVDPSPLYENPYNDPLITVAGRHIEMIRRTDSHLLSASIEGFNALYEIGVSAGMIAVALGGQLTETVDIIQNPGQWAHRFNEAIQVNPEARIGVDFMRTYPSQRDKQRRLSGSFLNKMLPILATPALRARYCTSRPGLSMQDVDRYGLTWIIDGRNVRDPVLKQQMLLSHLHKVMEYANYRGVAGRTRPMGLVIDEITALLGFSTEQNEAIESDIEELISVISRNYGVFTTVLHQSLQQISSKRIRAALMSMPNQFIGGIHDPDDRLLIARQFFAYDPYKVKKEVPQYVNDPIPEIWSLGFNRETIFSRANYVVNQTLTEEFTMDEQLLMLAERFKPEHIGKFAFLMRLVSGEGTYGNELQRLAFNPFRGRFPDEMLIADVRRQLRERDGFPVSQLNAEIDQRMKQAIAIQQKNARERATMKEIASSDAASHEPERPHLPAGAHDRSDTPDDSSAWQDAFYEDKEAGDGHA